MLKQPAIYIVTNERNGTLYTGVTSNLSKRIFEHKNGINATFTDKHGCKTLVYYDVFEDMMNAIAREKQIKGGSRKKKLALIESMNPNWKDLYETLI